MSLVLRRKHGQAIVLQTSDGPIRIVVHGGNAKLVIDAPKGVVVVREELLTCEAKEAG